MAIRNLDVLKLMLVIGCACGVLPLFTYASGNVLSACKPPVSAPNIALDDRLIDLSRQEDWLIDLEEFRRDRKHYGDLKLPGRVANDDKAWLVVPLRSGQELLGLVMLSKVPRPPETQTRTVIC